MRRVRELNAKTTSRVTIRIISCISVSLQLYGSEDFGDLCSRMKTRVRVLPIIIRILQYWLAEHTIGAVTSTSDCKIIDTVRFVLCTQILHYVVHGESTYRYFLLTTSCLEIPPRPGVLYLYTKRSHDTPIKYVSRSLARQMCAFFSYNSYQIVSRSNNYNFVLTLRTGENPCEKSKT